MCKLGAKLNKNKSDRVMVVAHNKQEEKLSVGGTKAKCWQTKLENGQTLLVGLGLTWVDSKRKQLG